MSAPARRRRRFNRSLGQILAIAAVVKGAPAGAALTTTLTMDHYGQHPQTQAFITEMVERHGYDRDILVAAFAKMRRLDRVIDLIAAPTRPDARRIWSEYRNRFVDPLRIRDGSQFWRRHRSALRLASDLTGVPEAIIVAIIGVETVYGRQLGEFPVAESLATLAFDYPPRAPYFRGELEQYLLYVRDNGHQILAARGSYAGAMGLPQFMPTSLRNWAVDLDRDGDIDLSNSAADAVGSVANFLRVHGWVQNLPTHYSCLVADPNRVGDIIAAGPKPAFTITQLFDRGIRATEEVPAGEPLLLVDLPEADAPTHYILGTVNFYAITRYNRSFFYAMAVIELAQALTAQSDLVNVRGRDTSAATGAAAGARTGLGSGAGVSGSRAAAAP